MTDRRAETAGGLTSRYFESYGAATRAGIGRFDLVTLVLAGHGAILVAADQVAHPGWVMGTVVALVMWRVGFHIAIPRVRHELRAPLGHAKVGGSLLISAAAMAADGGTESPFFFWMLMLLASYALSASSPGFIAQSVVAALGFVGVILAVPDLTPRSLGRLGLLAAFCATLQLGRHRIEVHQRRARRSDEAMRVAFDAAPAGIALIVPESGEVVYANRQAELVDLVSAAQAQAEAGETIREMCAVAISEHRRVGPRVASVGAKQSRTLLLYAAPIGSSGRAAAIVGATDVTVEARVDEERRRFMLMASHQLRTPLTPIIAYADLLGSGTLGADGVANASREILAAGLELERLFDRMHTVAMLQSEAADEGPVVPVSAVLDEVQRDHGGVLEGVEVAGDPELAVRCRPDWIGPALRELLNNSHRFGEPPIHLAWSPAGSRVEFVTYDAGPGPDPSEVEGPHLTEWGLGLSGDTVPARMRTRLGLMQARLLIGLCGGELRLRQGAEAWAFVVSVPAGTLTRTEPDSG